MLATIDVRNQHANTDHGYKIGALWRGEVKQMDRTGTVYL
jgi:hypothetical protein